MKPPIWRQERSIYPHACAIQMRYADEDRLGHINNLSIAGYFDEARSKFSREVFAGIETGDISRIVTADSRVTYLAEVFYRDEVEVLSGILRIGTASYEIGQALYQDGRCVSICTTTFVQATPTGVIPLSGILKEHLGVMRIGVPEGAVGQ